MKKCAASIADHKILPGGYVRIRFHAPEIAREARPGQFVNILTSSEFIPYLRRPIGIEDVIEDRGEISMLVKVLGPGTKNLEEQKVGNVMDLIGPLGNGFDLKDFPETVFLVAGGTGIAPFLHLARVLRRTMPEKNLRLFYGGRTKNDLVSLPEFEGLAHEMVAATEDGSYGRKGLVTEPLREALAGADPKSAKILACGPLGMMKAASDLAAERGFPCFVSLETMMGCGIGSCLGCVVQVTDENADYGPRDKHTGRVSYVRVCTEGPVFDARTLTWEGLV